MRIGKFFDIQVARSRSAEDYAEGEVPFVTNTALNNGVTRYVAPFRTDKVFDGPAICISGLGHATVQLDRFLPKGNGGDSATILIPRHGTTPAELVYYAALFNRAHQWRFTFGRKANKRRIEQLELAPTFSQSEIDVEALLRTIASNIRRQLAEHEPRLFGSTGVGITREA